MNFALESMDEMQQVLSNQKFNFKSPSSTKALIGIQLRLQTGP